MQNSDNPAASQEYKLGKFKFIFPQDMKFDTAECDCYSAVIFLIEGAGYLDNKFGKYEVINNRHMGYRLFVSIKEGWNDIPFKKETFGFLHPSIKVIEEEE
jgi:hypothetical protein